MVYRATMATRQLAQQAKAEMLRWKGEQNIRAIVPKTANQKNEMRRYNARVRRDNRADTASKGAASPVRVIVKNGIEQ